MLIDEWTTTKINASEKKRNNDRNKNNNKVEQFLFSMHSKWRNEENAESSKMQINRVLLFKEKKRPLTAIGYQHSSTSSTAIIPNKMSFSLRAYHFAIEYEHKTYTWLGELHGNVYEWIREKRELIEHNI